MSPQRIPGRWKEGFVLDFHTVASVYLGDDEFGHPIFDTTRTPLGELLYRLKYRSDATVLDGIVGAADSFLRSWKPGVEMIVPVPPSKKDRPSQPVLTIATALGARLGLPVNASAVSLARETPELKNVYEYDARLRLLAGAHAVEASEVAERRILVVDDLFRSGATMNAVTTALYEAGATDVFALAITRTRSRT